MRVYDEVFWRYEKGNRCVAQWKIGEILQVAPRV